MTWKEPDYVFDPATSLTELMNLVKDAKCLVICYEENSPGKTAGSPIFAQCSSRDGINVYLTSNRPEETTNLARGKKIARSDEADVLPLNCQVLPLDYEISEDSKISIAKIERANAQYYRKLWTYNFTGAAASKNFAVFFADVKNVGAAIHSMIQAALRSMDKAGFSESANWVQLSHIFGSSAIPKETAEIISQAVKKMIDDGLIDSKNKLDFLKLSAEKYLTGD